MKRIVVFTGAGISKESGLSTFRDSDGLWENYSVEEVCTHEAIERNRSLVIDFYNQRRRDIQKAQPNAAHYAIAELAKTHSVQVITQNVDDLHERAGQQNVTHLHGEITKLRSSYNDLATVPLTADNSVDGNGWQQRLDARHPDGSLLRPYIVFFGEAVPMMDEAIRIAQEADILLVIGTSLAVYPAASLLQYIPNHAQVYVVDPGEVKLSPFVHQLSSRLTHIRKPATQGVPEVCKLLNETID